MKLKDLIELGESLGYQIERSDNHPNYADRKKPIFLIYRNNQLVATYTHTSSVLSFLNKNI